MTDSPLMRQSSRPLYRYVVTQEAVDQHESVVIAHNRAEAISKAKLGDVESTFVAEQWKPGRVIGCTREGRVDNE